MMIKCKLQTMWGKQAGIKSIAKLAHKFDDSGKFQVNISEKTILQNNKDVTKICVAKGIFAVIEKNNIDKNSKIFLSTNGSEYYIDIEKA